MRSIAKALKAYLSSHPFHSGSRDSETVLDQLYQVYAESHEPDPPEIEGVFVKWGEFLDTLSLDDDNTVFSLCCELCTAYEKKAFQDGLLYGAYLMRELFPEEDG